MLSQGTGVPCGAQVPARVKRIGRVVKFERTNAGVCKGPVVTGSRSHVLPGVKLPRTQTWTASAALVAM